MPIIEEAPGKYHRGGVTSLQYVSGTDDPSLGAYGAWDESPLGGAVKFGLLLMGVACLLGAKPPTSRLLGIVGVGYGLLRGK